MGWVMKTIYKTSTISQDSFVFIEKLKLKSINTANKNINDKISGSVHEHQDLQISLAHIVSDLLPTKFCHTELKCP